jgi:phosphate transport system substrate-binding protein
MKKHILLIMAAILIISCHTQKQNDIKGKAKQDCSSASGKITLSGAWALFPLTKIWTAEFQKLYPNIQFEIIGSGSGQGLKDLLDSKADIGMISSEIPIEDDTLVCTIPVARLAVVPIINKNNPYYQKISERGLKRDEITNLFSENKTHSWGDFFKNPSKDPVKAFIRNDLSGATDIWLKFLWMEKNELIGEGVANDEMMVKSILNNPLGIGYCNFVYIFDVNNTQIIPGIAVLPMDINSNGKIDPKEKFMENYSDLQRAMWLGKYPCVLTRDLCLATHGSPNNPQIICFLKWVLTEGQKYIEKSGYIQLRQSVINCKLNGLNNL